MASVRLSDQVQRFLEREALYLIAKSPAAAASFLRRFGEAQLNLSRFPEIGRKNDALPIRGAFRLIVGDYVLDYKHQNDVVTIVTMRHSRQNELDIPIDEDPDI